MLTFRGRSGLGNTSDERMQRGGSFFLKVKTTFLNRPRKAKVLERKFPYFLGIIEKKWDSLCKTIHLLIFYVALLTLLKYGQEALFALAIRPVNDKEDRKFPTKALLDLDFLRQ
jgi:hypothetical protein